VHLKLQAASIGAYRDVVSGLVVLVVSDGRGATTSAALDPGTAQALAARLLEAAGEPPRPARG
jgi:hypothetical protein